MWGIRDIITTKQEDGKWTFKTIIERGERSAGQGAAEDPGIYETVDEFVEWKLTRTIKELSDGLRRFARELDLDRAEEEGKQSCGNPDCELRKPGHVVILEGTSGTPWKDDGASTEETSGRKRRRRRPRRPPFAEKS